VRTKPSLLAELISLSEATAACYHIITHAHRRLSQDQLERARSDIAVALANLVPVFGEEDGQKRPLRIEEIYARFNRSGLWAERVNGLYVRRSDVVNALETLLRNQKEARGAGDEGNARA
jgi:hypothetical protein